MGPKSNMGTGGCPACSHEPPQTKHSIGNIEQGGVGVTYFMSKPKSSAISKEQVIEYMNTGNLGSCCEHHMLAAVESKVSGAVMEHVKINPDKKTVTIGLYECKGSYNSDGSDLVAILEKEIPFGEFAKYMK